jgi:AraC family transcriptional regulator
MPWWNAAHLVCTTAVRTCNGIEPRIDGLLSPRMEQTMQMQSYEPQAGPILSQRGSPAWVHHLIALLDSAIGQLGQEEAAHGALRQATSLLRRQMNPHPPEDVSSGKERLLAWQVRRVVDHIDHHITARVLVADLCALVQRSEAHFSRSFRHTFGHSPHAFVIRRRVELAGQYMVQTDAPLSHIALQCGFVDQAHLAGSFER